MSKPFVSKGLDPEFGASQAFLWPIILPFLPPTRSRILDLGCGSGGRARVLADLGHEVVGTDVSLEAVEIARRNVPEARFLTADINDFPWETLREHFDIVMSLEVIEHLYYPRRLLSAAALCLRPGGVLILSTPYHGYLKNLALSLLGLWDRHFGVHDDGWHIKFFSPRTLRRLVEEAGFADLEFRFGGRLPLLWKSMVCRGRKP